MIRGWETTEFYTTCAMHVITILTLFNVWHISGAQNQAILDAASFVGSTIVQSVYSHGRATAQTSYEAANPAVTPLAPTQSVTEAPSAAV